MSLTPEMFKMVEDNINIPKDKKTPPKLSRGFGQDKIYYAINLMKKNNENSQWLARYKYLDYYIVFINDQYYQVEFMNNSLTDCVSIDINYFFLI
jgi:hypothetical protein